MIINFQPNAHTHFTGVFYKVSAATAPFVVVYGGAASGKSYAVHQHELIRILQPGHGDTLLLRKHATHHRHSCYKLLNTIIDDFALRPYFRTTYSEGNKRVTCLANNRSIILLGADRPEKLKSISNISRVVMEEADHFTYADFTEILRRARGFQNIQYTLILNPVSENHWIKKQLCDPTGAYHNKAQLLHFTYRDNRLPDGTSLLTEQDAENLERLKTTDPNQYRIYALGQWGIEDKTKKFAWAFDPQIHVVRILLSTANGPEGSNDLESGSPLRKSVGSEEKRFSEEQNQNQPPTPISKPKSVPLTFKNGQWMRRENVKEDPSKNNTCKSVSICGEQTDKPCYRSELITYASFDFNVNPLTCTVFQLLPAQKTIRAIQCFKLHNSDIWKLCAQLKATFPKAFWKITGDATGSNRQAISRDNLNYYQVIQKEMRVASQHFAVPNVNPPIEENQLLVNTVLKQWTVQIDPERCEPLIYDLTYVEIDEYKKIIKNRSSTKTCADFLDTFRYFVNAVVKPYL